MTISANPTDSLPRSSTGGYLYCLGCTEEPTLLWVGRNGVRLCDPCRAAAEARTATDQPNDEEQR